MIEPLSIAPMMDRTDRHFRTWMRTLTRRVRLYTEMVNMHAVLHGDRAQLLGYEAVEHPVALQLGGDDPEKLAECARIAEDWGYDEVNLNVGCPSNRVKAGNFGAVLMGQPELVARCLRAMSDVVSVPVTCKHRIGIDEHDSYEHMLNFVDVVHEQSGCTHFIVHARKAWLQGLSPKENRNIPPIRYEDVYRLKADRPHLSIEINGHVQTLDQVEQHLQHVDGVMIGRAAVDEPYLFASADQRLFGEQRPVPTRADVVRASLPQAEALVAAGEPLHRLTRHMLTLYTGIPGTRVFKRILTEGGRGGPEVLLQALDAVEAVQARNG